MLHRQMRVFTISVYSPKFKEAINPDADNLQNGCEIGRPSYGEIDLYHRNPSGEQWSNPLMVLSTLNPSTAHSGI